MRLMLVALLGLSAVALPASPADEKKSSPLTVIVMDPLAAELSCPCVAGYAQRDYNKLGKFLEKQLGRPVKVHFSESLTGALTRKTAGKADLIIGKDSVVRHGAKENKLGIAHVAALTGKDGKTTMTGLWVVAGKDPAVTAADLKGYELLFGTSDADEKYRAALALLRDLEVPIPARLQTVLSCSTGAKNVVDGFAAGKKIAAVVSSYAQPLLEGCGTVKKGDLKVIGETDPVPFISAFVTTRLSQAEQSAMQKALLAVGKDAALCKVMETKHGFVLPAGGKKK
jgi:ABC-type phosphate/phosphonate transport system substrate-binding protein